MMRAAAETFQVEEQAGADGFNLTAAPIENVYGPIQTTVTLVESHGKWLCLVMTHALTHTRALYQAIQRACRDAIGKKSAEVFVFNSHNHSSPQLTREPTRAFWGEGKRRGRPELTPIGERFVQELHAAASRLPGRLEPVTVAHATGRENTIAYNRKGRRADGSTYFMREEDRRRIARDFHGDVDSDVPVVMLRRQDESPVTIFLQYTAHPATAYDPEVPNVFGEYPQVACEVVSEAFDGTPVGFLQGAAGDINSKGLLTGDADLARRFGERLGRAAVKACRSLKPSTRDDAVWSQAVANVPLGRLPSVRRLERQRRELESFVERARSGDPETLGCIGLNFPRALTPAYRAALVEPPLAWTKWALRTQREGKSDRLPKHLPMDVSLVRLGDVGVAGMPCEPFVGIGREIRAASPLPFTIPCGYTNLSYGYVPDSPNTGDREYVSSFYLYTRFRPPYRKPAGSVLARIAVDALRGMT